MLRKIGITSIALSVLLLLAGCTPQAEIYARVDGETLQIASCEESRIERVTVSTWSDEKSDWVLQWESQGESINGSGLVLSIGTPPEGWTSAPSDPDTSALLSSDSVSVKLWHSPTGAYSEVFNAAGLGSSWGAGDGSAIEPRCL